MSATRCSKAAPTAAMGGGFGPRTASPADELLITVLPGSRNGEVARLLPIFGAALNRLKSLIGPFRVAVPTVATVAATVADAVRAWPGAPIVVRRPEVKYDAFAASRAALAASGSVALELRSGQAADGRRISAQPADRGISGPGPQSPTGQPRQSPARQTAVSASCSGDNCTPERLAAAIAELVRNERVRAAHYEGYDEARRQLESGGISRAFEQPIRSSISSPHASGDPRNHSLPMEEPIMAMTETAEATKPMAGTERMRLLHTMLRVRDLDASLKFYTDQLGMKLLRKRDYPSGKFTLAFVGYGDEADNTVIELTHNWDQAEPYTPGQRLWSPRGRRAGCLQDLRAPRRGRRQDPAPGRADGAWRLGHRLYRGPGRLPDRTGPALVAGATGELSSASPT